LKFSFSYSYQLRQQGEETAAVFSVILREYNTNRIFFLKSTFIRYLYPFYIFAGFQQTLLFRIPDAIGNSCRNSLEKANFVQKKTPSLFREGVLKVQKPL